MVYKRIRVWTSGRSLPVYNFVEYPPAPGLSQGCRMRASCGKCALNQGTRHKLIVLVNFDGHYHLDIFPSKSKSGKKTLQSMSDASRPASVPGEH